MRRGPQRLWQWNVRHDYMPGILGWPVVWFFVLVPRMGGVHVLNEALWPWIVYLAGIGVQVWLDSKL